MAVTLIDASGFQFGVENDETGINIESYEVRTAPEFKRFLLDKSGEKRGFAVSAPEQTITLSGEISGSTGVMAFTFTTACTIANDKDMFGVSAGDVMLDEVTVSQSRDGWRSVAMSLSRNGAVTVA